MLLLFGRLSVPIVCPLVKFAAAPPVLFTVKVQVQVWPTTALPLTLLLLVIVRSEPSAIAQSENDVTPLSVTALFTVSTAPPCAVQVPVMFFQRINFASVIPANSAGSM